MEPVKWRGRSVAVQAGEVFEFQIASPEGGCEIRYNYTVHDELSVSFSIRCADEVVLTAEPAVNRTGEIVVTSSGMCTVRWENASMFAFSGIIAPRSVSYEVIMVPLSHLALGRRRRLVQLAETSVAASELLASLAELSVDSTDERGRTPLHGAAAGGNTAALTALLQRSAPLEARSVDGRTALLEACAHGQPDSASTLLAAGADVSAVDSAGRTAMHLACLEPLAASQQRQAQTVRLLLGGGAAAAGLIGERSKPRAYVEGDAAWVETPLVCAARSGLTDCCTLLLEAKADANECGGLPLVCAASHGRLECVEVLLGRGANSSIVVGTTGSALHAAAAAGHAAVVTLLATDAAEHDEARTGAAMLRTDSQWRAPLMVAAAHGHGDAVEALLAAGAPIEHPTDREGNTPLLAACAAGDPKSIGVLLQAGAKPKHKNASGHDGLLVAAIGGHLPVLPLLLPACGKSLPDAMVQAAAHGRARTAVALMELCPFPLPAASESRAAAKASSQLLQAVWQRCCEEHLGIDPTSLALEAAGGFGEKAAAVAAGGGGAAAAVAATAAATLDVDGGVPPEPSAPPIGETFTDEVVVEAATADDEVLFGAEKDEDEDDGMDDLTNIQELIRRELLEDDDDDDDGKDDV